MFELVTAGIHFICTIVCYCFYFSYKTGQFLVTIIHSLLYNFLIFANNLIEIVIIILESVTIFSHDVVQCFQQILKIALHLTELFIGVILSILDGLNNTTEALVFTAVAAHNFIVNSILNVVILTGQFFIFLKRLLILFGSGVWFSITFIPLLLVSLGTLCTYYLRRLIEEILDVLLVSVLTVRNVLRNFGEFLMDVPVESAAGIMVAVCLLYSLTQAYSMIYAYVYQQVVSAYRQIGHRYRRLRRRQLPNNPVQTRPRSRPFVRSGINSIQRTKGGSPTDERYCVICQECVKCILVLPCRHVCMCNECSDRLQLYNNVCPICRNEIESTMKIFV